MIKSRCKYDLTPFPKTGKRGHKMSNQSVKFKTSLNGYSRSDVNKYILETNQSFEKKEAELKEALADAENKAGKAQSELDAKASELESIKAEYEAKIAELESEKAYISKLLAETEAKLAEAESAPGADDPVMLSTQIGSLMISANTAAESIKLNAQSEAKQIVDGAKTEADAIKRRMNEKAEAALASLSAEIRETIENTVSDTLSSINDIKTETDALIRRVDFKKAELENKLENFTSTSAAEIRRRIGEFSLGDGDRG